MNRLLATALAALLPTLALAAVVPRVDYSSDVSKTMQARSLTFRQYSTWDLGWRFYTANTNTALSLAGATTITFSYAPKTSPTWREDITGALENTGTNGQVLVRLEPADINTNGTFAFELRVSNSSNVLAYAFGELNLLAMVGAGQTNALPVGSYSNGAVAVYSGGQWTVAYPGASNTLLTSVGPGLLPQFKALTGAGLGDMTAATYDPAGGAKQVAFAADLGTAAYSNASAFASAAQGAKADTALQPASTSSWVVTSHDSLYPRNNPSGYVDRASATSGVVIVEADTLQTVVNRGGTATNMGAVTMVGNLTMGTNLVSGMRFGEGAGISASGTRIGAYGFNAGGGAQGDYWGAYGDEVGINAVHTNSHSFGRFAGMTARGDNRMYLDVYSTDPYYTAGGATNDTIFMDSDGKLYLGGGAGRAENPSAGGVLRGTWDLGAADGDSLTGITPAQAGASPTGHVHYAAEVTNLTAQTWPAASITNPPWATNTLAGITGAGAVGTNTTINGSPIVSGTAIETRSGWLSTAQSFTDTATGTVTFASVTNAHRVMITTTGTLYMAYANGGEGSNRVQDVSLWLTVSNSRPVVWPTTYWVSNGAESTNAPTLGVHNLIEFRRDYFNRYLGIICSTNATLP